MTKFLSNISLEAATDIQFKTTAGANAGKIEQDGNDLVLTNAVGDILLGDGASDVFIGDGTNNVDIIFEQSGSIKGDGSAVTLTLGGSNTTLNLENPNINGNLSLGATTISNKLTFTGSSGYILFDYEPSGDTGEYTTEVPLLKVDRGGAEYTILSRVSEYGALQLGHDDGIFITAGETGAMVKSNFGLSAEVVGFAAEGGYYAWGFPNNMQSPYNTWASRYEMRFRTDHYSSSASDSAADALANNGLYIGQGASTQFIDMNRNLKNIGTITAAGEIEGGSLDINGNADIAGSLFVQKSSTHVAQGSFSANESHLDLFNSLQANTDQKGSIITFTDNYYDGTNYQKTTRAGIKGGTDTVGNTADGYLEFYTDSGGGNSPTLALRLDKNQNAAFAGAITSTGTIEAPTLYGNHADGNGSSLTLGRADSSNYWQFNHAGGDLRIYNSASSGSHVLLGVDPSGTVKANNVGIGTATPDQKLHVVGNFNLDGNADISGNLTVDGGLITIDQDAAGSAFTWKESDGTTVAGQLRGYANRGDIYLYSDGTKTTELSAQADSFIPALHIGGSAAASGGVLQTTGNVNIDGNADISGTLDVAGDTTITNGLYVNHNDGIQLAESGNASTSRTTLKSFTEGGNSKMLIKGGNFVHQVDFQTSKNSFKYANLKSSYNGGTSELNLYQSNSDTTGTAATTTISTGTSTFAGNIVMAANATVDGVDISGLPTSFAPTNATNNSSNATLLARANHTGSQAYSTISDPPTIPSISGLASTSYVDTAETDAIAAAATAAESYADGLASNYATAAQGSTADSALQSLSGAVLTTGAQTIAGNKTFSNNVSVGGTLTSLDNFTITDTKHLRFANTSSGSTGFIQFGDSTGTGGQLTFRRNADNASVITLSGDKNVSFAGDITVAGNLNITGDINSVSVTDLDITDKTITIAKGSADSSAADGAGLIVDGAGASLLYDHTGTQWEFNKPVEVTGALTTTGTVTANNVVLTGDQVLPTDFVSKANGGTFGAGIIGTTSSFSGKITTGYGVGLEGGAINYLLYGNTGDSNLYLRDMTSSPNAMITSWSPTSFSVQKNLIVSGSTTLESNVTINTPSANSNGQGLTINRPAAGTHYASVEFATNGTVDWAVGTNSSDAFEVYENGNASTTRFSIAEGGNATFSGTVGSGAITSTGKITGTELEGTSLDINGAATFDTNANGIGKIDHKNSNAGSAAYTSIRIMNDVGGAEIWRNSSTRTQTGGAAQSFNIYNNQDTNLWSGGTRALHLDTSQNATFAGTIGSGAITSTGKIQGTELEGTSLDINGAANIDGLLDVNTGAANTVAIFESTDDKAFIRIKDDDTDTHLITKDSKFHIGTTSSDYTKFKLETTPGNLTVAGTFTAGGQITGTELEGTSLDINGNAAISGNLTGVDDLTMSGNLECVDVDASGTITGNGSGIDSINAGNIASGTLAVARGGTGASNLNSLVQTSGNQTIGGVKTFTGTPTFTAATYWQVSTSDAAVQRADARDDLTNFSRLHWYGIKDDGNTSNFRHAWYDGSSYIDVTAASGAVTFNGAINSTGSNKAIKVNGTTRINGVGDIIGTSYYVGSNAVIDTNRNVIAAELEGTSLDINGNADVSGTTTLHGDVELMADLDVGGVITGDLTGAVTGNASTATNVAYTGLTGTVPTWNQSTTGNAASATTAAACSGNSATATALTSGNKTIAGNAAINGQATLTSSLHPLIINRTGGSTALVNVKINGTSEGFWGATATKSFTVGDQNAAEKFSVSNAGVVTATNDVIAFSDKKLKENIETLDGKKVLDMRGVSFTRKDTGEESSGVIAQEIQKVAPELVHDTEGTLGVAYGNLVGYLIEAVKDQQKQIDELKELCNGCSK